MTEEREAPLPLHVQERPRSTWGLWQRHAVRLRLGGQTPKAALVTHPIHSFIHSFIRSSNLYYVAGAILGVAAITVNKFSGETEQ